MRWWWRQRWQWYWSGGGGSRKQAGVTVELSGVLGYLGMVRWRAREGGGGRGKTATPKAAVARERSMPPIT